MGICLCETTNIIKDAIYNKDIKNPSLMDLDNIKDQSINDKIKEFNKNGGSFILINNKENIYPLSVKVNIQPFYPKEYMTNKDITYENIISKLKILDSTKYTNNKFKDVNADNLIKLSNLSTYYLENIIHSYNFKYDNKYINPVNNNLSTIINPFGELSYIISNSKYTFYNNNKYDFSKGFNELVKL